VLSATAHTENPAAVFLEDKIKLLHHADYRKWMGRVRSAPTPYREDAAGDLSLTTQRSPVSLPPPREGFSVSR